MEQQLKVVANALSAGGIVAKRDAQARPPRPNRIRELTKARKWTYPEVAERVRALASARGDDGRTKVHTITINRLATGAAQMTQEWMNILGEVFNVPPAEIISPPAAENLRRVQVIYTFQGGHFRKSAMLSASEQYQIVIPRDPRLDDVSLYAGEIRGEDVNTRYPAGAIVLIAKLDPGAVNRPGEVLTDRRYHVRVTRADGLIEDSIRCLVADEAGRLWLKPESNRPEFQEWMPLTGRPGHTVELLGRVRGVLSPED
ncbi:MULTISPECIES: hypothetical protein [unclassified Bradyrhizobium]|uniref:hypothetical protein n=1 Tax=unclassified Bradyrhizobium TaxID=2631580 RepID=UPI00291603CF|nr:MULTISPECIES: hypothetical protein [unclassified Bradyrhizobium]